MSDEFSGTMRPYTVLLLTPDYLADTFGHDVFLGHATADSVSEAIRAVREEAARLMETDDPDAFHVLMVCEGHVYDIKHKAAAEEIIAQVLLTKRERQVLSRILLDFASDTGSNINARLATSILEKLRQAE